MTPLLGVKWSPISDAIQDDVDVMEVAGWSLDSPGRPQTALLHNVDLDFSLTTPGICTPEWIQRCQRAIRLTSSPWFSLHLGFSAESVYFDDHMHPASPVLSRETCYERIVTALRFLKAGLSVPLLIENLDYCPEGAYEHVCDPDFIRGVAEAVDCRLLLDLAHVQVSADWLGYDVHDYLARLPLERVDEVHLSSPRQANGWLDDGHYELIERDYIVLDWLLENSRPQAVVLEYIRDPDCLAEQVTRLRRVVGG